MNRSSPTPTIFTDPPAEADSVPLHLARIPDDLVIDADVREDLRAGREPFARIMAARNELPDKGVLRVRAIFEPVPLYRVMARDGLEHWTEQLGPEDWRVWFHAPGAGAGDTEADGEESGDGPAPGESATGGPVEGCSHCGGEETGAGPADVVLDVRDMEPPEPLVRTLEALEDLPAGATLLQVNARVPRFLLPHLEERGFTYEIDERGEGEVHVRIRRAVAKAPSSAPGADEELPVLDVRVIPPREKHPTIFATWEALEVGQAFVLVNDHDPKPLRYQFQYEHPGDFAWRYLEKGPAVWRVRISRTEPGAGERPRQPGAGW